MSQDQSPEKFLPILEILGETPPPGTNFCATCAQMYLGAISEDAELVAKIRGMLNDAIEKRRKIVNFVPPRLPDKPLRVAVTIAPSVYFAYPAPVCWIHMIPYVPQNRPQSVRSALIPGSGNWKDGLS